MDKIEVLFKVNLNAFPAIRKVEVASTLSTEQLLLLMNDAGYPAQLVAAQA